MRGLEQRIAAAGMNLVFVGTGTPAMALAFANEAAGPHPVLCDRTRAAFAAARMRRGLASVLHPRALANALRALRAGFRQTRVQGDPWQQGGVLVFDGKGALVHAATDAVAGDAAVLPDALFA
ncbi:MAG: hypothetical protein RIT25_2690 [Planctomycetota bacterium]